MEDLPLGNIKDKGTEEHLRHIYEKAQSNDVKVMSAVPTTDTLRPKDAPVSYDDKLWFNIEGTIYYAGLTAA